MSNINATPEALADFYAAIDAEPVIVKENTVKTYTSEEVAQLMNLVRQEALASVSVTAPVVVVPAEAKPLKATTLETAVVGKFLRFVDTKVASPVECYARNEGATKVMSMTATTISGVAVGACYVMEKGLSLSERLNAKVKARKDALAAARKA
jgi:hypothetical protein